MPAVSTPMTQMVNTVRKIHPMVLAMMRPMERFFFFFARAGVPAAARSSGLSL